MTTEKKGFYYYLKRFNQVIIAIIGILVLLTLGQCTMRDYNRRHTQVTPSKIAVQAPAGEEKQGAFVINSVVSPIGGTPYVMIYLSNQNTGDGKFSYSGYGGRQQVDALFVNTQTGASKWLFNSINQRILFTDMIRDNRVQPSIVTSIFFSVLNVKTNKASLIRTDATGDNAKTLIDGLDKITMRSQIEGKQFLLGYELQGKTYINVYDALTSELISSGEIPAIGK